MKTSDMKFVVQYNKIFSMKNAVRLGAFIGVAKAMEFTVLGAQKAILETIERKSDEFIKEYKQKEWREAAEAKKGDE